MPIKTLKIDGMALTKPIYDKYTLLSDAKKAVFKSKYYEINSPPHSHFYRNNKKVPVESVISNDKPQKKTSRHKKKY